MCKSQGERAMEKRKDKVRTGISWADEVEREEQEEEGEKQRKIELEVESKGNKETKPNPFGDARPREVVLEEKGVNWRKLDQDLERNRSILRKDTKLKGNKPSTPPLVRRKPNPINLGAVVPPLRYAPKNIMALMEKIQRGRKDISDATTENSCPAKKLPGAIIPRGGSDSQNRSRQMHADGRKQVPVDLNYGKNCNDGDDYGYPCSNTRNVGEDLRDAIRIKRRVSTIQNGPCNQKRKGKQAS